jgi:ADP-ribose pyrophosphatase YjhB (NUDIX family)
MNEPLNHTWRPPQTIRAKVIGIVLHEGRLLVCEVVDDHGKHKGWCPLGGGIEFGETREEALQREIREELGCGINILQGPFVFDNIFDHHGHKGHDIILAYLINLEDSSIYVKQRFQIRENHGSLHWVEWIDLEKFYLNQETLFPTALLSHLKPSDDLNKRSIYENSKHSKS